MTPINARIVKANGNAFFWSQVSSGITLLKDVLKFIQVLLSDMGGGFK